MQRFVLSFAAVEGMRAGAAPRDACRGALERMREAGAEAEACLIALDLRGRFGAAAIGRASFPFAVWADEIDDLREVAGTAT